MSGSHLVRRVLTGLVVLVVSGPLTVALAGTKEAIQIVLMAPHVLASDGRLDALAERLVTELTEG